MRAAILVLMAFIFAPQSRSEMIDAYIGTSGTAQPGGKTGTIHKLTLDTETGTLSAPLAAAEVPNPMFLAVHPEGRALYVANHTKETAGEPGGSVSTLMITKDGLVSQGEQPAAGVCPCHLAIGGGARVLATANYGGANVTVFPVSPDGSLKPRSEIRQHEGSGHDPKRQQKPFPHGVTFSPDDRFLCVADLGTDEIRVYELDAQAARLSPADPAFIRLPPGSGPRHLVFAPDGRHAYSGNELNSTVTALAWDGGRFTAGDSVSTLPDGFSGDNTVAEIMVSKCGRFVYASNRGHDSIAIFRRDGETGALSSIGYAPSGGEKPWSFDLTPCGRWMMVANSRGNEVRLFRVDPATGTLESHGTPVSLTSPMCVLFAPKT